MAISVPITTQERKVPPPVQHDPHSDSDTQQVMPQALRMIPPSVTVSSNIVMALVGVLLAALMVWAGGTINEASSSVRVLATQLNQLSTIQAAMALQLERTSNRMEDLNTKFARMEERIRLEDQAARLEERRAGNP